MSGTPWSNLIVSLREAVNKIQQNDKNRDIMRISIIKFGSLANLYCENASCNQVNLNLPYGGGGTDFDSPFNMAAQLAARYINNSIIVFVFMTDGESGYPNSGVQALKILQRDNPNRLQYAGI